MEATRKNYPLGIPSVVSLPLPLPLPLPSMRMATTPRRYRPRRIVLRDGREVLMRAVAETDAGAIVRAFERLSPASRYARFMQHKKRLNSAAVERGVHPQPGRDFVFVATIPAADGIDIVGAAQYVRASEADDKLCEFAITLAEDWRRSGLAAHLLASLVRRARRDGYLTMEGWVLAENYAMLALARKLGFVVEPVPGGASLVRVQRALRGQQDRRDRRDRRDRQDQ